MDAHTLKERLDIWEGFYDQMPLPTAPTTPEIQALRDQVNNGFSAGQFNHISELEVVPELQGTEAGKELTAAIGLARQRNASDLPKIRTHINAVRKYMHDNGLW